MSYELIEEHYRLNYDRLVKRVTWKAPHQSQALAEECVQEAYARAMKYFATYNPKYDPFEKWFEGILRNAINSCRAEEADRGVSMETTDEADLPMTPDRKGRIMALHTLRQMEEGDRKQVLSLFFLYGYTTKEIAEFTGINHNTVRQYIARWRNSYVT